ncbi:MAG: YveK family protein [Clostridiaceae bacterium]
MELREYFQIIKKRWLLVVVITLLASLISALVSYFFIKPTYKADISVIIGSTSSVGDESGQSYNDVLMYQKIVQSYTEIAKTRLVAEDVIDTLNLDMSSSQLIGMISVSVKSNTEILNIMVKADDAALARSIANQYAKSLKKVSMEIRNVDNVQLMDDAVMPTSPDSPRPLLNIAIAFFLGLMLSVGIIFLIEYLDSTIKSQEELERLFNVPVLGAIPLVTDEK